LDTSKDLFQYSDTSDKGTFPVPGHIKGPSPVLRHIIEKDLLHYLGTSYKGPSPVLEHIRLKPFSSTWIEDLLHYQMPLNLKSLFL
jgi:hypothetical protein